MSLLDYILAALPKKTVPTTMRTDALSMLPVRAREEGFFSAAVDDARILQEAVNRIEAEIMLVENGGGTMGASRFIREMKEILGAPPAEGDGKLTDISSHRRLKLLFDFKTTRDHARERFLRNTRDEDIRDEFPAQELSRVRESKEKRDWNARWQENGGKFYAGRMIARVNDPIWEAISRFGTPYPPFDFGSGMGVRMIDRREAGALGVIAPGEEVPAPPNPLDQPITAPVASLGDAGLDFLRDLYGDSLTIENGMAKLQPTASNMNVARVSKPASPHASNMSRKDSHEWREEDHPRDDDGKFSSSGQMAIGGRSLEIALTRKTDVRRAMMRDDIGRIDFEWGRTGTAKPNKDGVTHADGYGISHIQAKHPETLPRLVKILTKGTSEPGATTDEIRVRLGREIVALKQRSPKRRLQWDAPENERNKQLRERKHRHHYYVSTAHIRP